MAFVAAADSGEDDRAVGVKVGRLGWQAWTGCCTAFNNYRKGDQASCTMGEALANYCLSASINSSSPHKRWMHSMAEGAGTGLNWHTLLIKEVNTQPVSSAVALFRVSNERRAAEIACAVDIRVYLSFIPPEK